MRFHLKFNTEKISNHNRCNMHDNFENESVKENDKLLIDAVRVYPHLYNHKDPNFKNHLMKKNSWKEIAFTFLNQI
ncbi:Transcription factor Adf-1 [Vespula squamosa]|uniref:Transcription factor Adf-1 n=1 Tax=Vespula squamosa TaxID=30214 RepID=A0ABD2B9T8_VESSQ